jgi:hypothetical protein
MYMHTPVGKEASPIPYVCNIFEDVRSERRSFCSVQTAARRAWTAIPTGYCVCVCVCVCVMHVYVYCVCVCMFVCACMCVYGRKLLGMCVKKKNLGHMRLGDVLRETSCKKPKDVCVRCMCVCLYICIYIYKKHTYRTRCHVHYTSAGVYICIYVLYIHVGFVWMGTVPSDLLPYL